ncbi:RNA polymerase sigma factor [Myroides sp. LJL115]
MNNSHDTLLKQLQDPLTKHTAFAQLVELYQKRLYLHIRTIVLNHEDTDDVLQETFIKIYQNIDSFKGESQLFSWMYRIATNQSLDFLKAKAKKNKISNQEINEIILQDLQQDEYFDYSNASILLQKAVNALPEKQQLVFKMKYFQDMDYQSMSDILQTSVGALKASYHHAVKKIEHFLKDH